jgi:hypothetical protein
MSERLIYKYTLFEYRYGTDDVRISRDAKVLSVQVQRGVICLWAEVIPGQGTVTRRFYAALTGESPPEDGKHLATLLLDNGDFVVHVYEVPA